MSDGSGALSFAALDRCSTQLARRLRAAGLGVGERVALLMENTLDHVVAAWAVRRCEMRFVPVNWHLKHDEAAYIFTNSDARALIYSEGLANLATDIVGSIRDCGGAALSLVLKSGGSTDYADGLDDLYRTTDAAALEDEREGGPMPYSSGTTGRPKGILRPLSGLPFPAPSSFDQLIRSEYKLEEESIYLCPAPLYHAAPMTWLMSTQFSGGTAVLMPDFDAEEVLRTIDRHKVTHAQFVPTHFVRLLRLPKEVRGRYDISSLRVVVHAAAPCPRHIKQAMVDWWGPIIHEYYSGSERCGYTVLRPDDWDTHPGSVGKSITGPIHIVDPETGLELSAGEIGLVYFENAQPYRYHKISRKDDRGIDARGWGTLDDMGWLDADGYLYLADRASHMIISGGVNIYPREIEDILSTHPAVADVAVIGVPDVDFGEAVKAVVQLKEATEVSESLVTDLLALCRGNLAGFKCPRSVDFVESLPRLPTGKLLKRELRKRYWNDPRVMI